MPAPPEHRVVLGTAGHIDHGKTTLVRALTGVDTDTLRAEKERGISIELGFAPWTTPSGVPVSFVDVPGHERFVRHMIAGSSGVDGYVLCIAADEGVKPQTREHVQILRMLGVHAGVAAITRVDRADPGPAADQALELVPELREVVSVSVPAGVGLRELGTAIDQLVAGLAPVRADPTRRTRLFVDRCFSKAGAGTIVTGTVWGRGMTVADHVRVFPAGVRGRVRRLEVHGHPRERVESGRVAVAIAGVAREDAQRGSCLLDDTDEWRVTERVAAVVEMLEDGAPALRSGSRVQVVVGTAETQARVRVIGRSRIEPGTRALSILRLSRPLPLEHDDMLVLRHAGATTLGRARVMDPGPSERIDGHEVERLALIVSGDASAALTARLLAAGPNGVPGEAISAKERVIRLGGRAFHPSVVQSARRRIIERVWADPIPLATARAVAGLPGASSAELVAELASEGAVRVREGWVVPKEPPRLTPLQARLMNELREAGTQGRRASVLGERTAADERSVQRDLIALRAAGLAERLDDYWFDLPTLRDAIAVAEQALSRSPKTLSELRDLWGTSRRPALAIAEHMDRAGISVRDGHTRRASE